MYKIYHDSLQEGVWFKELHATLQNALLLPFPSAQEIELHHPQLKNALSFDRPDIILCDNEEPILVVERTVEVPSGHNVGQRFARLVAAAKHNIPVVYFGPYAAYKHGGDTQGPRYMNLRLFYALEKMGEIYGTAISVINWPVDEDYEIIRGAEKDIRMIEYLNCFFEHYEISGLEGINHHIQISEFEEAQRAERLHFITTEVRRSEQYDSPPSSLVIKGRNQLQADTGHQILNQLSDKECVLYNVGMTYVRSDPYTGMALLYSFLYCGGLENRNRNLVLYFPNITIALWQTAAANARRKDVRLYKMVSDAIVFKDGCLLKEAL